LAFLDEEQGAAVSEAPDRPRRRLGGADRRRQQFLIRRMIAVGAGVLFLILFVLGVRGCLDARKERGMRNYTQDVGAIMAESEQTGGNFFELMEDPGEKTDLQFQSDIRSFRGQSESLLDRAQNLDVPDEMSDAQQAIELALRLRRDGLGTMADNVTRALGDAERSQALDTIVAQMGALYSSDVLYRDIARPEIESVLSEEGIETEGLPTGNFMPEDGAEEWLDETRVTDALAQVSGGENVASGVHGLGLLQTALGGTALSPDTTTTVSDDSRDVEVQVQNQGESEETGVRVVVTVEGQDFEGTIDSIQPGATASVEVPLESLPQPGTETTLDVLVEPVPGEQVSENNESSYTVVFG
jgi:hypothetical protein